MNGNTNLTDKKIKDVEELYKIETIETSALSYTANVELNTIINISSNTPSGYKPVGIIGYNMGIAGVIRRLFILNNESVAYSGTSTITVSTPLIIVVLFKKN